MLEKLLISRIMAFGHCDIPCGIYDPYGAQTAAHTVLRMMDLIEEKGNDNHNLSRYTAVKEEHAEQVKHDIRVIWGDYFKPKHEENFPEIRDVVANVMKLASEARQGTDRKSAERLLDAVNKFSEIFWKTKNVETMRIKAPYPTESEMVVPKQ